MQAPPSASLPRPAPRSAPSQGKITIAHLDTGFDPHHRTLPAGLVAALQRNFVRDGGGPNDATDRAPAGTLTANRGHGPGTLSLLAGNRLAGTSPGWPGFTDFVGAAPGAKIIPVRIADWVVRLTTSTMVQGIDYARAKGAQVLSMSMGGLTSSALVDAVNLAYDHGVVMVTAAGNNFAGVPSPKSIVFPARYQRVLAACGVMARRPRLCRAWLRNHAGKLWPCRENEDGARRLHAERAVGGDRLPECGRHGWLRHLCRDAADCSCRSTLARRALGCGEELLAAVDAHRSGRFALFSAAAKSTAKMGTAETLEKIGQGVAKANAALAVMPRPESQLRKLAPAEAFMAVA